MKNNKILWGVIGAVIGLLVIILVGSNLGTPDNAPFSFSIKEAFSTIYFSGAWVGGVLGYILSTVIIITVVGLFYYVGTKVFDIYIKNKITDSK